MNNPPVHASLFSGIGGFDLAAEWLGFRNAFHCEINPFCDRILKYHFPDAGHYTDITKTDFTPWRGKIDILSGGFPCQPFSLAGQRKGAEDDRYLWPQMLRAIREIRPAWVVGENVAGILTMVQPSKEVEVGRSTSLFGEDYTDEEIHRQYIVETVCTDLEREGYSVRPFVIPACAVGAPHRRDRVWFVAHRTDTGSENMRKERKDGVHVIKTSAHTESEQSEWSQSEQSANGSTKQRKFGRIRSENYSEHTMREWNNFPTQSPVCSRDDGFPIPMDGITFSKWRQESIKAYGNAIVPQVAYEIFQAIIQNK